MRYFIELSYKGTNFHGWQRQPNVPSIQQTIEEVLSKMVGEKKALIGCGRTDAGVHAKKYFAHFKWMQKLDELDFDPLFRLNKMLPKDIAIHKIFLVERNVHAQYSAYARSYQYHFHRKPNPFLEDQSTLYDTPGLDIQKMREAFEMIMKLEDFRIFCKSPNQYKHTKCNIISHSFINQNLGQYCISIESNRFLQSMIRLIVARIIDVGEGKLTLTELAEHLKNSTAFEQKYMAYPQGLFLTDVKYEGF